MLNTFENADRHHLRRKDRERHVRNMELYSNSLDFSDDLAMCSMVDALSGFPLEKNATPPSSTPEQKGRRCSKYALLIGALVMVGVSLAGYRLGVDVGEHEIVPQTNGKRKEVDSDVRRKKVFSLILDWGVTSREMLEDVLSAPARAFEWLAYDDMETEDPETMRTRFALASLYFGTQSPLTGRKWDNDQHWLSSYPVCLWHGVECLDEHATIGLVKALNLSSNGLTGTLPEEIGLLELDIRLLDVSSNAIAGTIPETLFLMKNLGTIKRRH
jgi:hypothetical protein